jgi:hypothetical protein
MPTARASTTATAAMAIEIRMDLGDLSVGRCCVPERVLLCERREKLIDAEDFRFVLLSGFESCTIQ